MFSTLRVWSLVTALRKPAVQYCKTTKTKVRGGTDAAACHSRWPSLRPRGRRRAHPPGLFQGGKKEKKKSSSEDARFACLGDLRDLHNDKFWVMQHTQEKHNIGGI